MSDALLSRPGLPSCPAVPQQACAWQDLGGFLDRSGKVASVTVERCRNCGHGRTRPALADVAFLYEARGSQDFQPNNRGIGHAIKHVAFGQAARRLLRQLAPFGQEPASLLDFGCGSGQFTRRLGDMLGPQRVTGSDFFAQPPVDLADRPYLGMDQLGAVAGTFDAVLASHVLEHDDDTQALLARIAAPCRPGGQLVIEVPNIACVGGRIFGKYWDGWYVPFHRVHFSRTSLVAAVAAAGLEVQAVHPVVVPTIGRTLANLCGRDNTAFWLLLGAALHPLQLLGEVLTGEPSAWRVIARKPA